MRVLHSGSWMDMPPKIAERRSISISLGRGHSGDYNGFMYEGIGCTLPVGERGEQKLCDTSSRSANGPRTNHQPVLDPQSHEPPQVPMAALANNLLPRTQGPSQLPSGQANYLNAVPPTLWSSALAKSLLPRSQGPRQVPSSPPELPTCLARFLVGLGQKLGSFRPFLPSHFAFLGSFRRSVTLWQRHCAQLQDREEQALDGARTVVEIDRVGSQVPTPRQHSSFYTTGSRGLFALRILQEE
jgi:hypothetical protein